MMENKDVVNTIHDIFGVNDSFKLPDAMMKLVFNKVEREKVMLRYLDEYTRDLSHDGFHEYYQQEQAERKSKKQDFTPDSISQILSQIVGAGNSTYEPSAGTGGIIINKWHEDMMQYTPFNYWPSEHLYFAEELSDRALPFLLFNLAIRGMNAAVVHGDTLTREARGVFFIQNSDNNFLGFSDINVMPYSEDTMEFHNIKTWVGEHYPEHVESKKMPAHLAGAINLSGVIE